MTIFEEDYEPCSAMKCLQPWGLPFWMSKYASWMDCDWPKEGTEEGVMDFFASWEGKEPTGKN